MKSLLLFLQELLYDIEEWCCVSTSLDMKNIKARVDTEGIEFLTITLPTYGKEFERSLDLGYVPSPSFPGFGKRGKLPELFGELMANVFDRSSGTLLDVPDKASIQALRQLSLMFAKVELESSEERIQSAFDNFVKVDQELLPSCIEFWTNRHLKGVLHSRWMSEHSSSTTVALFSRMFSNVTNTVYTGEILPKHGPGTTAERLLGNKKYDQREWTDRMEDFFPSGQFLGPKAISPESTEYHVTHLEPGAERPVRVIAVPKTAATPRIISVEPTCMQYVQQGLLEAFVTETSRDKLLRHFISFDDQEPNQVLARKGSIDGSLATLDLSEASDRVANLHVRDMFGDFPFLRDAISSCRSTRADVPGHGVIPLSKFASMGSALTFPIETFFFLKVVFEAIGLERGVPITVKDIKSFIGKVRIYGDDIIVPTEYAECVIDNLHAYGLKVNLRKSFWNGKFRESCGKEYFDGTDVTITRVRRVFPTERTHVQEIISTVSLRNQLFKRGFSHAVEYLDDIISGFIPFPIVEESSPALGRLSYGPVTVEKMHGTLHKPLVWGCVPSAKIPDSRLEGWGALMKFFLKRGDLPIFSREHLARAGRPVAITLKTGWVSPK